MCQWGDNRNPPVGGLSNGPIPNPHVPPNSPNRGSKNFEIAAKSATRGWAHYVGSSSGLITIVVRTLYSNEDRQKQSTRSSPQWWSSRSMTAHIVYDLRWIIRVFSTCTIVHGITSQSANVFSNVLYWYFCRSPNSWVEIWKGDFFFSTPIWRVKRDMDIPIR